MWLHMQVIEMSHLKQNLVHLTQNVNLTFDVFLNEINVEFSQTYCTGGFILSSEIHLN